MATTRRRALLGSLAGAAMLGAASPHPALGAPAAEPVPRFYSHGGQFTLLQPAPHAPRRPIRTADGSMVDFPALLGKVALINFWATWCLPCAHEMPSLDRLAARLAGTGTDVLPIAMDAGGKAAVVAFYARFDLTHLKVYADPGQQIGYFDTANPAHAPFPLYALPITYLIDPRGSVVGYVPGAAEWDSPPARQLIAFVAAY